MLLGGTEAKEKDHLNNKVETQNPLLSYVHVIKNFGFFFKNWGMFSSLPLNNLVT